MLCIALLHSAQAFQDNPIHSTFLIGDAGEPYENPVLFVLKSELAKAGQNASIVILGDNIYPKGMPPKNHPLRAAAEIAIDGQIDAVRGFKGKTIFIPGNHDWAQGREQGLEWLNLQEEYVENRLDSADVWLPSNGCPGPVEVELDKKIMLIIIDTQWFLHQGRKPVESSGCEAKTELEAIEQFKDALLRNAHKKVMVVSHHPMFTYGIHGGVFGLKDHIFPLTAMKKTKNLYLPLPGLGSIYPLYRKWFGNIQDTAHPIYKRMQQSMVKIMKEHPNIIHAAGHEHALEHIEKEGMHFIVSGSGSKNNAKVKEKGDARFAKNTSGFGRVDYFQNGKVTLKFFTAENNTAKLLYETTLSEAPFLPTQQNILSSFDPNTFINRDTVVASSLKYHKKSNLHESLFGENYRQEWATPVKMPVFDIGSVKGGLKILKKGGGHQTTSLRLEDAEGRHYVLRSMDKNPALTLPTELRKTFIKDIVQDGISSSHPYAPFVIPPLADAAGILHANPIVYFIPDDPRFGIYRKDFANTVAIFEERANKQHVKELFFGGGEDDKSSLDVYKSLRKDNDRRMDESFMVKNRLFDMWLGDWDRHDDQWRWVEYDLPDDEKLYRPIPRDRDVVFFSPDGKIKKLIASKWAQPSLKGFRDEISYTPAYGFMRIRWSDRYFMTKPNLEDWLQQAHMLQEELTDEVIVKAFEVWPKEIYDLHGDEIIRKLKNRRDQLHIYAEDYYRFLSKTVDIRGSDKREWFVVERIDDEHTQVTVRKISKKGNRDKIIYERTFNTSITEEIRLFGFDGDDEFEVSGNVSEGIIVRIIGGDGQDFIKNESTVDNAKKHTIIYDTRSGSELEVNGATKNKTTDKDPDINQYNMEEFDFDKLIPQISFNYNPDDGVFLGGGVMIQKDGFRKEPYASRQKITGNYAMATSSYGLFYEGEFIDAIGKANFLLKAEIRAPNFVNNFFGLGNESIFDDDLDLTFYRTRFQAYFLNPSFAWDVGKKAQIILGARFLDVEIEENNGRFITDFNQNGLDPNGFFEHKTYLGPSLEFHFDSRSSEYVNDRGITFNTEFRYNGALTSNTNNSAQWKSDLTLRYALDAVGRASVATRVGYQKSFGDYEFFQASVLDGFDNMRGYRRYRFRGESSFSQQLDIRIDLFEWQNYVLPSKVGLILFNDFGRVWLDGEDSDTWHHGYGGGFYLTPFGRFTLNLLLAKSREGFMPLFKMGFYF